MTTPETQPGPWKLYSWLIPVALLVIAGVVVVLAWRSEPIHDRRDAILDRLPALAAEVNAYRARSGSLPQSLKDISTAAKGGSHFAKEHGSNPNSGYQLVVQPNRTDYLIVADHVFKEATGAEFYYASDGNLQIQKVPLSDNPPNNSAGADQSDGNAPSRTAGIAENSP